MEEEGDKGDNRGDRSAQTATAGKESREPGEGLEEQGYENEHPAEAPHVVVVVRGGVVGMAADEVAGGVSRIASPGFAKGRASASLAAILIVATAEEEVGPLGYVAGAGDAGRVSAQEVDLVNGCVVGDAGQDDEPEEEEGAREQDDT